MLGQGGGVLIWSPLLQKMIDEFGWRTTYRIMTGVVPVLFLFGITYSPNVESEEVDTGQTAVEEKKKGCHIDVSVWKEPKLYIGRLYIGFSDDVWPLCATDSLGKLHQ